MQHMSQNVGKRINLTAFKVGNLRFGLLYNYHDLYGRGNICRNTLGMDCAGRGNIGSCESLAVAGGDGGSSDDDTLTTSTSL